MTYLYKILRKLRHIYWWILRPITIDVRAIIINQNKEILLVKHGHQPFWYLPGGGVDKNETLIQAVKREIKEETGIALIEEAKVLGVYSSFLEYKNDHIVVFVFHQVIEKFNFSSPEIKEMKFFKLSNIPPDISPATQRRIKEYINERAIDFQW